MTTTELRSAAGGSSINRAFSLSSRTALALTSGQSPLLDWSIEREERSAVGFDNVVLELKPIPKRESPTEAIVVCFPLNDSTDRQLLAEGQLEDSLYADG